MILSNIQDLVSGVGLPASDNGLNVLRLLGLGLRDRLTILRLRSVLINEWAEEDSRVAEIPPVEECVRATDEYLESLRVARASVDELTDERASLTAGAEQAKAAHDALKSCTRGLEVPAAPSGRQLGVLLWAMQLSKGRATATEDRGNTAKARAPEK